jgi:predicted NACHT family NTPase
MKVRAKRSLKASAAGINRANQAVLMFATKFDLAAELDISRATVQNFFAGKSVGRENFHKICQKLNLPWQEIAELNNDTEAQPQKKKTDNGCDDVDALVKELRQKGCTSIQQRCGMMRVLDMSQPIELNNIYSNVNILEKISGRRRLEVAELVKVCVSDEFDRLGLGKIAQERVLGLEAAKKYSNLMVLGKPGAGKTTFLKHIAIKCSLGEFKANLVPIFIILKDFAEKQQRPSLLQYITEEFATCGVNDTIAVQQVLSQGKALVLLDGLDEVRETDEYRVVQEIRNFSSKFHVNHFVITCRIATREYTFEQFTEVEVADFNDSQIATFVNNWFAAKNLINSNILIQKLKQNPPIQELATNPLLLTLLCLMFEESADFPANRSELYEEGLNVLLKKWDAKRNIKREQVYKNLCIQHKVDLLSQIAFKTFERGDYFFRRREIEQHIADYICNLPGVSTELVALQLDREAVLKSIEAQHGLLVERARGIYSFSHLTIHEYFTAKKIVSSPDPQSINPALKQLVSHIGQKRWHEVFLLSVGMLRNADYLLQLMKQQIDQLLAADEQLQSFLTWVSKKSRTVNATYRLVIVRAFYFDLDLAKALELVGGTLDLARAFNRNITRDLDCNLALDLALDRTLALNRVLNSIPNPISVLNNVVARAIDRARLIDPELEQVLQQLKKQVSHLNTDSKRFEVWWKSNGEAWTEQLRAIMISYRHLGHDWQFSKQQKDALKQYYEANQLLVDCLNSNCYVTSRVRQEIEETLLLPLAEL